MTRNDLELNACCLKIKNLSRELAELQAQNKELALSKALGLIEEAARKGQWRLLELKPLPPLVLPPSRGPVSG